MSAEEMRTELESFVNQGLEEGWRGWPTRGQATCFGEWPKACGSAPAAQFRRILEGLLLGDPERTATESRTHRLETWLS